MLKLVGLQVPHQGPHRATLELENPHRIPCLQHLEDLRVVEWDRIDVRPGAGIGFDELCRNANTYVRLAHTAFKHMLDVKLFRDVADIEVLSLELEARRACRHA